MTKNFKTNAKTSNLLTCVEFVEDTFKSFGLNEKDYMLTLMEIEDAIMKCITSSFSDEDEIEIEIFKRMKKVRTIIKSKGKGFKKEEIALPLEEEVTSSYDDVETSNIVRRLLKNSYETGIKYKRYGDVNKVVVDINRNSNQALKVIIGMILGLLCGILLKNFAPDNVAKWISGEVFDTIYGLFISFIALLIGPLVFFSIGSALSGNDDYKSFGKIGGGVIKWFVTFSLLGAVLGIGLTFMSGLKDETLMDIFKPENVESVTESFSINKTVLGIFPDNLITPFVNSDVLKIMIIAIIFGLVASRLANYKKEIQHFFDVGNELFTSIIGVASGILPVVGFSSIASVAINVDGSLLLKLLGIIIVAYIAMVLVIVLSFLIAGIATKRSPIALFKKTSSALLTAFASCSSCAAMPVSMKVCKENLGVDKKIYSFAIPLGATIDMAGCTTFYATGIMFFLLSFNFELTLPFLLYFIIIVLFFSAAEPAAPGGGLAIALAIIEAIGLPGSLASLFILFTAFSDNICTAANVMGDILAAFIVAFKNGMIDEEIYNKEIK